MELSKAFQKILTKQGIKFRLETKVTAAEKTGDKVRVHVESVKSPGQKEAVSCFYFYFLKKD